MHDRIMTRRALLVTILIAEGSMIPVGQTQLAHLDKSHVTVYTYPEYHPETCLATFRVDI